MKLSQALEQWIKEKKANRRWSAATIRSIEYWGRFFCRYLNHHYHINVLEHIQREHLKRYFRERLRDLSRHTQRKEESFLFLFFDWCVKSELLLLSPMKGWKRIGTLDPANRVLSLEKIQTILNAIDTSTVYGIRDRAIIETLYATAIRRMELIRLDVGDVDIAAARLWVHGKFDKGRIVPISKSALHWIRRYLKEVRSRFVKDISVQALFISRLGGCSGRYLNFIMKKLRENTGISPISSHVFRHSCATHLMDAGVPVPYIQAFLGHSSILSTQHYLHVSSLELTDKYLQAHPRDKWD